LADAVVGEGMLDLGAVGALGEGTSVASAIAPGAAAGAAGSDFLSGMSDVAATEGAGVSGTGISSGITEAEAASTVDAASQANPLQSIKDTLKGINSTIDSIAPPGVRQGINVAYQLSKGGDPTQIILNGLKSQALSGLGSDIATATGSKDLGQFTTGTIGRLMSGQDPMKAIEGGALGVANSEFNTNLKDATGLTALPNFNISSVIDPSYNKSSFGSSIKSPLQAPTQPLADTQSPLRARSTLLGPNTTPQDQSSGLQNTASLPTLGLPQLGIQSLNMPTLGLPGIQQANQPAPKQVAQNNLSPEQNQLSQLYGNIGPTPMKDGGVAQYAVGSNVKPYKVPKLSSLTDYTQIDPTLTPTQELVLNNRLVTPQQYAMLTQDPVVYSAKGGAIDYSKIVPELLEMLQKHAPPKRYAGEDESSVKADSIWDNPEVKKIDWKALEASATPKFAQIFQPKFLQPRASPAVAKLSPLGHLHQGPLNALNPLTTITNPVHRYLTGRADGGLAKYKEAAPEGHNPEFITGVTGYYAGGRGTGQSDDIPAMLHDGDYVMDADAVAALGDGSSKAGNDALMKFMHQVPHHDHKSGTPVPAKIADGEVVLPESFVTALGGGDNKHGAKMLDAMREELREHKRSAPTSKIPPKAKSPLDYLKMAKG
jgi:hypothetical protein